MTSSAALGGTTASPAGSLGQGRFVPRPGAAPVGGDRDRGRPALAAAGVSPGCFGREPAGERGTGDGGSRRRMPRARRPRRRVAPRRGALAHRAGCGGAATIADAAPTPPAAARCRAGRHPTAQRRARGRLGGPGRCPVPRRPCADAALARRRARLRPRRDPESGAASARRDRARLSRRPPARGRRRAAPADRRDRSCRRRRRGPSGARRGVRAGGARSVRPGALLPRDWPAAPRSRARSRSRSSSCPSTGARESRVEPIDERRRRRRNLLRCGILRPRRQSRGTPWTKSTMGRWRPAAK